MTDDLARKRFFTLVILRFAGVALAFLGIAVIMKRLIEPADVIGTVLLALGAFDVLILPTLLVRRWKSER
jgi:hypothetical protein